MSLEGFFQEFSIFNFLWHSSNMNYNWLSWEEKHGAKGSMCVGILEPFANFKRQKFLERRREVRENLQTFHLDGFSAFFLFPSSSHFLRRGVFDKVCDNIRL